MEFERENKQSHETDKWILAFLVTLWIMIIIYTNRNEIYVPWYKNYN